MTPLVWCESKTKVDAFVIYASVKCSGKANLRGIATAKEKGGM